MTAQPKFPTEPESGVRLRVLPVVRGDCLDGPRPCQHHACRHNLHRHDKGTRTTVPTEASCSLDLADTGPHTLEEIANVLGITRERVRQVEEVALAKLARRGIDWRELLPVYAEGFDEPDAND